MGAIDSSQRAVELLLLAASRDDLHCVVVSSWGFAPDDPQMCKINRTLHQGKSLEADIASPTQTGPITPPMTPTTPPHAK